MSDAASRLEYLLSPSNDGTWKGRTSSDPDPSGEVAHWTDVFLSLLDVIRTRLTQLASRARGNPLAHAMIYECARRLPSDSDDKDALFAASIVTQAAKNGDERLVLLLVEGLGLDPAAKSMQALSSALRESQFAAALLVFYLTVRRAEILEQNEEAAGALSSSYSCHDPRSYCFALDHAGDIRVPLPDGYTSYVDAACDPHASANVMANVEMELIRRVTDEDRDRVQAALTSFVGMNFAERDG